MPKFWFDNLLVRHWLPEGSAGAWTVKRVPVEGDPDLWLSLNPYDQNSKLAPPSIYTELRQDDRAWMSDRPAELLSHENFVSQAAGDVLIFGLGLGIMPLQLASKTEVNLIHVVELNREVIELVNPYLQRRTNKVTVMQGSAFDFRCSDLYDWCWIDIWRTPDEVEAESLKDSLRAYALRVRFWRGN